MHTDKQNARKILLTVAACVLCVSLVAAQTPVRPQSPAGGAMRVLSGVVVTPRDEVVPEIAVNVRYASGRQRVMSDGEGRFRVEIPPGATASLQAEGDNITATEMIVGAAESADNLEVRIEYIVAPIHESVVIEDSTLEPGIERRNDSIYKNGLFSRDDQIFQTLDAGINAGQHEGGGKSLEIRRFGFNLDHGGVSGGLKVLVDGVGQNQATQGHGQGYLGSLKSVTPELVAGVDILNGPFSAQYGDFSGLGVVHVRRKESLPDELTVRVQGGSFNARRAFVAYSPELKAADALVAYEGSQSDGPFHSPLRYRRDNLTGNYTRHLGEHQSLGFKFNAARNDFYSSGQIPLDEVAAGRLDRFGFLDPDSGGRVQSGQFGVYYSTETASGGSLKIDANVSRSLFDLYSNFTFFLNDELLGDEIQQHDSRLQEAVNVQYLRPLKIFGRPSLLIAGGNFHANQINVGLYRSAGRDPFAITTDARARVNNYAGYIQQTVYLLDGRLRLEGGLRYDYFRFDVDDRRAEADSFASQGAAKFQPKASLSFRPSSRFPAVVHFNYGRGISSQDARGVARNPAAPKISTTDFYQLGTAFNWKRFSLSANLFLIDRSNEQVYIPDDDTIEFAGPTRAHGYEAKASFQLTSHLSFNGGLTQVMNAFYRGTRPRVYVDGAPHTVANAAVTLSDFHGLTSSLRYRHAGSYRLDGEDANLRASGLDVLDLSMSKRLNKQVDLNFSIDNLTNKRYFETQNYFASRLIPSAPAIERIHGTPGYPLTMTFGLTFRLWAKG
ncbi:MAG: TonB-dependent receptor [Acidobacteria bacterium]|nr:TonB-dependent receptor [Acidobacteriota bacterium]